MASHNQGLRVAWNKKVESFQRSFYLRREGLEKVVARVNEHLKTYQGVLLDAGCGPGLVGDMLKKHKVLGVDFSHKMLLEARKKLWNVVLGDLHHLPFKHGLVDVIITFFVISDYPQREKKKILGEIMRVLKPGGLFFLADYSPRDGLWQQRKQLHTLLGELGPEIYLENLEWLAETLEKLGLSVVDKKTVETKVEVDPKKFFTEKFHHIPREKVEKACQKLNTKNRVVREFIFLAAKKPVTQQKISLNKPPKLEN